jgi:hypothetical protein
MQRKPNFRPDSNAVVAAFLLLSAAISVALLAVRNLSDDEISSLNTITSPVAYILRLVAVTDAHPPGMYLLGHFAYRILPSFRWLNLFSAMVLYAGLALFLSQVTPLLTSMRSKICLLLIATLHPQLLMWGVTYRWYGWWTGLALITITVALQPRRSQPYLGTARALVLGLLLASLFYLNFITFLFALSLAAAMLLRYRAQRRQLVLPAFITAAVFLALAAPQFPAMIAVHLPNGESQRSSVLSSSIHLLQSIAASEAYLPWHPLAIAADLLFAGLCIFGLIALMHFIRSRRSLVAPIDSDSALPSILLLGLLFFFLVAGFGLGGKPRNGLVLIPVLAPSAALITASLRPRAQTAILIFFVLWSAVGIAHLAGRYGLAKASMISHQEQVAAFIRQTSGPDCSVVVTYDAVLAFTVTQADLPRTIVVSPFREPLLGGPQYLPGNDCTHVHLYVVESYSAAEDEAAQQLQAPTHFFDGPPRTDSFSFDPDAARKRSLARIPGLAGDLAAAAALPDYRYVVISGPTNISQISAMRQSLPDYISGQSSNKNPLLMP